MGVTTEEVGVSGVANEIEKEAMATKAGRIIVESQARLSRCRNRQFDTEAGTIGGFTHLGK